MFQDPFSSLRTHPECSFGCSPVTLSLEAGIFGTLIITTTVILFYLANSESLLSSLSLTVLTTGFIAIFSLLSIRILIFSMITISTRLMRLYPLKSAIFDIFTSDFHNLWIGARFFI